MSSKILLLFLYFINGPIYFAQCFNILKDNYDHNLLKNVLKDKLHLSSGFLNESSDEVTYDDILKIEKESDNFSQSTNNSLVVRNFYLFTRDYRSGAKYELLDPRNISSIKYCHFLSRTTYVLIHGFIGYGLEPWILTLKDKLLKLEDCNVISVDWPAGERWFLPTYYYAAGRVPSVGNNTASLIGALVKFKGLLLENVHCIGHSLGGHVCGFSSKPFQGRVGRISGLDPAGPLFHNLTPSERLDRKDALYVDVIHTNACTRWPYWTDCYGLNENVGHSNFFPNGGEHQPGCWSSELGLTGEIGCDHERAYMYYISSLDFDASHSYFLARPCTSWLLYEIGNCSCGEKAQFMGYNVNTELDGNFYLETTSRAPFAMEDPDCPIRKNFNILIFIGYTVIGALGISCVCCILVLVIDNIRRSCRSLADDDDDESLISSDEDSNLLAEEDQEQEVRAKEESNSARTTNVYLPES